MEDCTLLMCFFRCFVIALRYMCMVAVQVSLLEMIVTSSLLCFKAVNSEPSLHGLTSEYSNSLRVASYMYHRLESAHAGSQDLSVHFNDRDYD